MSPPVVKNVCKSAREEENYVSFAEWYDDKQNIYIGKNAGKYTQRGVFDGKWVNPFICTDWNISKQDWVVEEMLRLYETYVRKSPQLMSSLHELEGKQLGCWCKPGPCHGDVLVSLYKEKYGEEPAEKKRKTDGQEPAEKKKKSWG